MYFTSIPACVTAALQTTCVQHLFENAKRAPWSHAKETYRCFTETHLDDMRASDVIHMWCDALSRIRGSSIPQMRVYHLWESIIYMWESIIYMWESIIYVSESIIYIESITLTPCASPQRLTHEWHQRRRHDHIRCITPGTPVWSRHIIGSHMNTSNQILTHDRMNYMRNSCMITWHQRITHHIRYSRTITWTTTETHT